MLDILAITGPICLAIAVGYPILRLTVAPVAGMARALNTLAVPPRLWLARWRLFKRICKKQHDQ